MDVAVKAVSTGDPDLPSCYIQGESAPYYFLVPASSARDGAFRPLESVRAASPVGGAAFVYLRVPGTPPDYDRMGDDKRAVFLDLRDRTTSNVTADVRERRKARTLPGG